MKRIVIRIVERIKWNTMYLFQTIFEKMRQERGVYGIDIREIKNSAPLARVQRKSFQSKKQKILCRHR